MTTPTKAQHSDISDEEHPSSRDGGSEWSTTNSEVDSHMSDNDSQSDDYVTAESRSLHDDSDDAYPSRQTSLDALEKNGVDRDSHDSRSIHSGSHSSHNDGGNVEDSRLAVPDKKAQLSNHHGDEGMDADENQISNQDGTRDNTGSQYGANTQPINDYESRNSYISLTDEVSPHNRESSLLEAKYFRSMNQAALENIERLNNLRSEVSHVGHPDLENSEDESSQYDSKPDSKGNGSPSGRTSSKTNRGGFFSFFGSKRKNEDKEETTVHPVKKAKTAEVDLTPPGDNSEDSEDSEEDGSVTSSEGTGSIEESASEEYEKDSEEEDYDEASQPKAPKRSTTAVDRPAKRQRTRGLMDKQITWQHIEVEELDLHQTYVGHNTPVKKPTQKRWQASGGEAITDPEKVPKGWTDAEPDLDEEDIEAQIARCEQRIEDKILPALFAMKLQGLRKKKAEKDLWMSKDPGLTWQSVRRLNALYRIKKSLQEGNDPFNHLPCVNAIIAVYKSGGLAWNAGLVTYWKDGEQLCQPRPYNPYECDAIYQYHLAGDGFWVEGLTGPGPTPQLALFMESHKADPGRRSNEFYRINVRKENAPASAGFDFEFLLDTGAHMMVLYENDLEMLDMTDMANNSEPPKTQSLGTAAFTGPTGDVSYAPIIRVHAEIFAAEDGKHEERKSMTSRDPVEAILLPGGSDEIRRRLDGPWARHKLYMASVPSLGSPPRVFMSGFKTGIRDSRIPSNRTAAYRLPPFQTGSGPKIGGS